MNCFNNYKAVKKMNVRFKYAVCLDGHLTENKPKKGFTLAYQKEQLRPLHDLIWVLVHEDKCISQE